jgi:hypothetical protein
MITRTHRKNVFFSQPFRLKSVDRILPPGDYQVVTDEELIEELSFPVYRRVSTMIFVPAQFSPNSSIEMVTVDPLDLQAAQDRDAAMDPVSERNPTSPAAAPKLSTGQDHRSGSASRDGGPEGYGPSPAVGGSGG